MVCVNLRPARWLADRNSYRVRITHRPSLLWYRRLPAKHAPKRRIALLCRAAAKAGWRHKRLAWLAKCVLLQGLRRMPAVQGWLCTSVLQSVAR